METRTRLTFNAEQQQAIDHRGAPLRIIAGAGTGKTATLTARFVSFVERGEADIGQVLALTFTHKAASEMKERIAEQLDRSYTEFWVETFHAFCKRVLRIEHALQGQPAPRVLTGQARATFLQRAITGHEFPAYGSRTDELEQQALRFIDRAKDELLTPEGAAALAERRSNQQLRDLARAYDLYQQRMRARTVEYDWGELQSRLIEMFRTQPAVLERWQGKFRFILVDEYQDINEAQCTLIELLAGDCRNLTVVGDVDQSIYAFRGASHRLLADLVNRRPETATIYLTSNFRSHQPILDAGNALISLNPDSHDRQRLTAHDGRIGTVPTVITASNEQEEADAIARQIARLHLIENVPLGNIAVLLRSVQVSAGPIELALASYGLRSTFSGDIAAAGEATADVLAILRLIDGDDDADMIRVLSCQGIEPLLILSANIDPGEEVSLLARLGRLDPESGRVAERTISIIQALANVTLPEQVYQAARICGRLPLGETISRDDYRYVHSLRQHIERATEVAESGGTREDFLRELESGQQPSAPDAHDGSAVQIMTIHAAKGLEFDHVFVANLAYGRFPLRRRLDRGLDLNQPESLHVNSLEELADDAERKRRFLEEERRLGYVALTRAIDYLYLSHARTYSGSKTSHSVFLNDIRQSGDGILDQVDIAPPDEGTWSASELSRAQLEQIDLALDDTQLTGEAIGDLLLAQWTLAELPGASPWRSRTEPFPHDGSESLRLSYSGLKTYETCPRRYYYSNILRLADDTTSAYALRGNILHSAIQWANMRRRDGTFPTWDELGDYLHDQWDGKDFDSPAQEHQIRHQCEQLLRRFHAWEQEQEREILGVELTLNASLGNHTLTGRIDCVARRPDGTVEIIDYKSGKSAPTKIDQKMQLGMYQLAFSQHNTDAFPTATIYLLGNKVDKGGVFASEFNPAAQIKSQAYDQEILDEVAENVLETAGRILRNEFTRVSDPNVCTSCAYRFVCEGASDDV